MAKTKHWAAAGVLDMANVQQVLEFFRSRLVMIGQNPCKKIHVAMIDAVYKSRQDRPQYCERIKRGRVDELGSDVARLNEPPPFWPAGVQWQGSHRLCKKGTVID